MLGCRIYYVDTSPFLGPLITKLARLFTHGGSQAVRLPAEFRFSDVDAVFMRCNAPFEVVLPRKAPLPYAASGEQSRGVSQIGDAVTQLDQVTQHNAALVEESGAAAESLKHQAAHLAQAVSTFRLASAA